MKIEIRSLTLVNFKGIRNLMVKCGHETDISGENATGKTTIFDAFTWLLFGKDSIDRSDFGIKTIDENGKVIPMIDHEVMAQLAVSNDGDEQPRLIILRRIYREKWVKPRGQAQTVFSGHETTYYFDQVPCSEKEYRESVERLCKENIFKLMTNPHYFTGLNWTIQRQALFSLIPNLSNEEIIASIPSKTKEKGNFEELVKWLGQKLDISKLKIKLASDIKNIKDELDLIPARIDEVTRGKPQAEDWTDIELRLKQAEGYILRKEEAKTNRLANVEDETKKRSDLQVLINTHKQRMTDIRIITEDEIRAETQKNQIEIRDIQYKMANLDKDIETNANKLSFLRQDIESLNQQREGLLADWRKINAEEFNMDENDVYCPVCKQELPEDMKDAGIQTARERFNREKAASLNQNKDRGIKVAEQLKAKEILFANTTAYHEGLKADREKLQLPAPSATKPLEQRLADNKSYQAGMKEIEDYQNQLNALGEIRAIDVSDLDVEIRNARSEIGQMKEKLSKRETIIKADARIDELSQQQQKMSQDIATLERDQFSIETFTRSKVKMLEQRINDKFSIVKFKMFEVQVNGQLADTCECSVNGVPYSDLNNAARINAGIDIINTMSAFHGIVAPIFIDNRESVNDIIPTQAQLISLYVTKDEKLKIETR